ncbi:MAG: hypothetical protein KJ880_01130 [Candidatus Omnitrophica bacterium]|nr:hypothetical protein [Candidatus Omnitrophota bacterium]
MAGICFYFGGRIATAETKASDDRTIIRAEFRAADEKLYDRIDARQIRMENKLDKIYLELKK